MHMQSSQTKGTIAFFCKKQYGKEQVMEKIKPRTLSGFMELLPARQAQMERFMQKLRETYSL